MLMQTVEKAASQNTQVPTVTEGAAAALLLSKLSVADSQAGKGLHASRVPGDGTLRSPWSSVGCFASACLLQGCLLPIGEQLNRCQGDNRGQPGPLTLFGSVASVLWAGLVCDTWTARLSVMRVSVLPACMATQVLCATEVRRGCQIPCTWSYRQW